MFYRQCRLQYDTGAHMVTWLDASRVNLGVKVKLKGVSGLLTVTDLYNPVLPEETIKARERDWIKMKKATDI